MVHGERVFIFDKPLETALLTIPACQTAWTAASKTIQPQFAAASKAPDTVAAIQKAQALADQAEETFLKCYKDQVASQKFFPGLMLQARELADRAG